MTAAVGAALSQARLPRFPNAIFKETRRRKFIRRQRPPGAWQGQRPPRFVSRSACTLARAAARIRAVFPDYSIRRNTCVNLAGAEDDFIRQYFYVIFE
jgi:hypothetical protein